MKRRPLWALAAAVVVAALPAATSAALLWTLVASPLTTTVNVSTSFTLTATNLDPLNELGCLKVDLPASFVIEALGTPTASNNRTWSAFQTGQTVTVHSLSGGGRLVLGGWVRFTIRAHGMVAGTYLWPNESHRPQDCSKTAQIGVPLSVSVLPVIVPTPTAAPTATPAPTPTAAPTASPAPTPTLPVRTANPTATPGASIPASSPASTAATPDLSAQPTPTAAPSGSASTPGGSSGSGGTGRGGPAAGPLQVGRPETQGSGTEVGVELLGMLGDDYAWFVPAMPVALPGLLVILWVALQAVGGLAWIPWVRRMANADDRRRSTLGG